MQFCTSSKYKIRKVLVFVIGFHHYPKILVRKISVSNLHIFYSRELQKHVCVRLWHDVF
jgi:hypothetical protein